MLNMYSLLCVIVVIYLYSLVVRSNSRNDIEYGIHSSKHAKHTHSQLPLSLSSSWVRSSEKSTDIKLTLIVNNEKSL